MADQALAPLSISCPSCGMPAEDFDMIKQEYRCRYCGTQLVAAPPRAIPSRRPT